MVKKKSTGGDWSKTFIADLNKAAGTKVFFDLTKDTDVADVSLWVSTGTRLLDSICSARIEGGLPEGRFVEMYGKTGIGKSHVAYQICREALDAGGAAVYADSEHATNPDNLWNLDVFGDEERNGRFAFVQPDTLEEVFERLKQLCDAATEVHKKDPNVPFVFVWDSVAASSPKAELEGDYDDQRPAMQARALSRNLKKFVAAVAKSGVVVLCLNQVREKIGVMFGNPETTSGGRSLPFYSSIRISLQGGSLITNSKGNTIGINVTAKTVKNKLVAPFRDVQFEIHFGVGIKEHQQIYDLLSKHGQHTFDGKTMLVEGGGQWKYLKIDGEEVKKFRKNDFHKVLEHPEFKPMLDSWLEAAMGAKMIGRRKIDTTNYEEVRQAVDDATEGMDDLED